MKYLLLLTFTTLFLFSNAQNKYANIDLYEMDDYSELDSFFNDSILDKYKVYFTGENHKYAYVNSELEYKILTYLHQKQNVKHFLFEQSPAVGYIMTRFVVESDLENKYFLKSRFFKPFYELIADIHSYNNKQDTINKIKIHGIDIERFPAFSIFALDDIVDTLDSERKTGIIYESIRALASSEFINSTPDEIYNEGGKRINLMGDVIDAWSTLQTIIDLSEDFKVELKDELGDNYNVFFQILDGVEKGHDWYMSERKGDLTAPLIRERFMLAQFKRIYADYKNDKFYGQFGRCHLHGKKDAKRCYSHDMESIASRINTSNDTTLTGKVLTIPVYYRNSKNYDAKIIEALDLSTRFSRPEEIYLIDLEYLGKDNPIAGFKEDLPYVIINNFEPRKTQDVYSFEYTLDEYHAGVFYGYHFFNKINKLNFALTDAGNLPFTNKFLTYSFVIDYLTMNDRGYHVGYNYIPEVSNGNRFKLKGSSLTIGNYFPFGNKTVMGAFGVFYTYGQMSLVEQNDGTVANLIQSNASNVTVYKNDIFTIDPNIDLRFTLPIISINARVGYAIDVSGKYWKLDGKMKDFTKTSFTSPYVQVGLSLNFKDEY